MCILSTPSPFNPKQVLEFGQNKEEVTRPGPKGINWIM